ncbi:MAG: alpha/beta hydrolase [Actinobacteria bacterium]|nr:alpha/beta hydrolase [Actinomycetota bacterium]
MKLAIESQGSGEPILLIHGLGSAATAWKPLTKLLIENFQVLSIDLPGHGNSPFSPDQPMDPISLAKLVINNIEDLGIERFNLVGNSLGGWISLEMAAIQPEKIKSIVALAPAGLWLTPFTSRYPGEVALRVIAEGANKVAPSILNYSWAKKIGFETVSPRWRELDYEICLDATNAMAKSHGYFPAWDALLGKRFDKKIDKSIPVTIVFGDTDHTLPEKTCQERSLAPEHAKWVILPETGHAPMWDSTELVYAEVLNTVRSIV